MISQSRDSAATQSSSKYYIIRELKRNTGKRGYRAKQAQQKVLYRRHTAEKSIKLTHRIIRLIVTRLREKWSPEQISGWLKRMQIYISQ